MSTNQNMIDLLMEDILIEHCPNWTWKVTEAPFCIQFYNKTKLEIIVLGKSAQICASRLGIEKK